MTVEENMTVFIEARGVEALDMLVTSGSSPPRASKQLKLTI